MDAESWRGQTSNRSYLCVAKER